METKMEQQSEKLLSSSDLGQILNCSKRSVHRYCRTSKIPAPVRLSGSTKWKLSEINLFLECNCNMAEFQARKEKENEK